MADDLSTLLERQADNVRAVLNILVETPYFYRTDHEDLFFFLRRYQQQFMRFFQDYYGWTLLLDQKCARVYKERWYNPAITEANRELFGFRKRDECLAFMMLLEFYEHQLEENDMGADDLENLRFRFGDFLHAAHRRFHDLYPDKADQYSEDGVRRILREIFPSLEKYRLVKKEKPPADLAINDDDVIFEALPALYHYNSTRLAQAVQPADDTSTMADDASSETDLL